MLPFGRKSIALALPFSTNANNVTLRPGFGQSWRDVDLMLSRREARYPDAPSAVGCCLAIRKSLITRTPLLDEAYSTGYWEDTDLHFSVTKTGCRSVILDNMLVFHGNGSSSFATEHDLAGINMSNRAIFMKKWGALYIESLNEFRVSGDLDCIRDPTTLCYKACRVERLAVLFVLLAFLPNIGGIEVVIRLVETLIEHGIRAAIYVIGNVDWGLVNFKGRTTPFISVEQIEQTVPGIDHVFATSWDSFPIAQRIARAFEASLEYLVQGPEVGFENGRNAVSVVEDYKKSSRVICVSPFISNYVASVSGRKDCLLLRVGPSRLVFYPDGVTGRDKMAIAICWRHSPLKGTGHAIMNCVVAKRLGFAIHIFGEAPPKELAALGKYHGNLSHRQLARLLNSMGYYLDCSMMEGLGLLPLEAAFCGAVPIVRDLHGLEHVLDHEANSLVLPNEISNEAFFRKLRSMTVNGSVDAIRSRAQDLAKSLGEEAAYLDFESLIGFVGRDSFCYGMPIWTTTVVDSETAESNSAAVLQRALNAILSSNSWKITKPIRLLGATLRLKQYQPLHIPPSAEQQLALLLNLTSSTSWMLTAPLRRIATIIKRGRNAK